MGQISITSPEAGDNFALNPSAEIAGNFAAINGAEMLTNGGFETHTGTHDDGVDDTFSSWTVAGTNGIADSTATAQAGTHAIKITAGAAVDKTVFQDITVVAGYFYKLIFQSRGDATYQGRYRVYDLSNSADIIAVTATGNATTAYAEVTNTFTAPAGCTSIRLNLYCPSTSTGIAYYDAVSLVNIPFLTVAAARSTTYAYKGLYSYHIKTASDEAGIAIGLDASPNDLDLYITMMVRGTLPTTWQWSPWSETTYSAPTLLWTDGSWSCYGLYHNTWLSTANYLYIKQEGAGSADYYIDCIMVENLNTYPTTYIDGDQKGCWWTATPHGSKSSRSAQYRGGGRVIDLEDTYGVKIPLVTGFGMPDPVISSTPYAMIDGSAYRGTQLPERNMTVTLALRGSSMVNLHATRNSLTNLVKPNLVSPVQPVRIRYTANTRPVEIDAYYAGGLGASLRSGKVEFIPMRFRALDPMWHGIQELVHSWTSKQTVANTDYAARRANGTWYALKDGGSGSVLCMAIGPDKCVYLGGDFLNWDGIANADYIVKYDPVANTFSALGTGMNGIVRALVFDVAGNLYAGGDFLLAGGVANTPLFAKWNGTAWSAVGGGSTLGAGGVYALAIDTKGNILIGGTFSNWGGSATFDRLVYWDGSAYQTGDNGSASGNVYALVANPDGTVYVGGNFTALAALSTIGILKINVQAGGGFQASTVGTGGPASTIVYALALTPDNVLYIGGDFANWGDANGDYIVAWTGAQYVSLGTGLAGGAVKSLFHAPWSNYLLVGGAFTSAGGDAGQLYYTGWKGTPETGVWMRVDVSLPSGTTVNAIKAINDQSGSVLYLGYDHVGDAAASNQSSISTATNISTANSYPRFVITRSGGTTATLVWIKNETTGKTLNVNYALLDGETIEIDCERGTAERIGFAFWTKEQRMLPGAARQDILPRTLLRSSDFATWALKAGANDISFYIADTGSPTITALMYWYPTHLSVDGAV